MKKFITISGIQHEVLDSKSDFIPNKSVDIAKCMLNNIAPPEVGNLEYDSDQNGEGVSFDDASPIIPDKVAAAEQLQNLSRQYARAKADKAEADKLAAEAAKVAAAADTKPSVNPSDSAGK